MSVTIAKWTLDEYHRMIAAGLLDQRRVELLKGEIVEMSPEGEPHAYFSSEAGEYLAQRLGDRALVRQAKPITLPNQSEPEPDIAIVQRLGREYLSHHPYPENIFWLIEYADSSLDKDLQVKARVYAEIDIAEYWVIDLRHRILIIFRQPNAAMYQSRVEYQTGNVAPLSFPDVAIAVNTLIN
ncbi:MAG: Uma2 family endonuclease [Leptolyngbyaceae cyanobacterium]